MSDELDNEVTILPNTPPRPALAPAVEGLGRIDQYVLEKELGGGGFGTVFLAHDTVSDTHVAVKGLPPEVRNNLEELENIRDNFKLVSRLHHPNIAAALVLHPAKEVAYADPSVRQKLRVDPNDTLMVMEYAPGTTLSRWRKNQIGKRVPADQAVRIVRQIAAALDFAHERRIIHRDIKPANIMIEGTPEGATVRVLDFGLAAEVRSSMGRISQEIHETSGTRPYMAPEQWKGEKQGPATDQYSLAVLYCELVAGEVPFQSVFETGDPVMMLAAMIKREPNVPDGVPHGQHKAVLRALSKDPKRRFPSCTAFVDALEGKGVVSRIVMPVVVTLALLALAGGGYAYYRAEQVKAEAERVERERERARQEKIAAQEEDNRAEQARLEEEKAQQAERAAMNESNRLAKIALDDKLRQMQQEADRKAKQATENEAKRLAEKKKADEAKAERERQAEAERKAKLEADRKAEETRKAAAAARTALLAKLAAGSEFLPNPPVIAAGTEKSITLPDGTKMAFVWCPPGRFLMGSPETEQKRENGESQHLVTLTKGFWIGKYEVTRDQWKSLMGRARFALTSLVGGDGEFPVDDITWAQARDYCRKLESVVGGRCRLPTEAEWEYACRAGTATPFSFGSALNGDNARCAGALEPYGTPESGSNSYTGAERVGRYVRSPWGIYDMHGNVFEWCEDYYGDYPSEDVTDPKGPPTGSVRVIRGGCWNYAPKLCRSAFRGRKLEGQHDNTVGFRVCCETL